MLEECSSRIAARNQVGKTGGRIAAIFELAHISQRWDLVACGGGRMGSGELVFEAFDCRAWFATPKRDRPLTAPSCWSCGCVSLARNQRCHCMNSKGFDCD